MQQAITLLTLNELIKATLDNYLSPGYWVIAEIGEFRDSVRGHAYLDLIEKTDGRISAKIRANIWSYTYQGIKRRFEAMTGENIRGGMKIMALVNVQFHEIYGLSLNIKDIDPNYTIGERAKKRQEVIERLTKEGLIQLNQQFVLPKVPQKIAVISSITAAGFGDFINHLKQNPYHYRIHYELYQAAMQGDEAPDSIIQAINAVEADLIRKKFDLLVIIRGGGAQTDMDSFDDYELAKHIANAPLPVITGIGHERDESVADLVAHTKMKTPTAVAAFILSGIRDFEESLLIYLNRIEKISNHYLQRESRALRDQEHILKNLFLNKMASAKERLYRKNQQLLSVSKNKISMQQLLLNNLESNMRKLLKSILAQEKIKIQTIEKDIGRLNPQTILQKGYTRTEIQGKPIHQKTLQKGDEILTFTLTKKIKSTIATIEPYDKN